MKLLSINAGSSSLKFQMYEMPDEKVIISGLFERIGICDSRYTLKIGLNKIKKTVQIKNHEEAVKYLIDELLANSIVACLDEIKSVGHRVVHGGDIYRESVVIDDEVINDIEKFSALAPLHNPANILGVKAFIRKIPNAKSVAVFDTAFHQTLEPSEYLYALPYEWYQDYKIRKYGFHGTSHKYLTNYMIDVLGEKNTKIITCHLGNGGSISAIKNGKCIDTSMGFTPNAGIVMGTRCGDIDATIIPYVIEKSGKSLSEVMNDLNKKSGFLGLTGVSSDSRDIEEGLIRGDERYVLTHKMMIKSIVSYIAKYYVLLNGVDAICFAGGIGENSAIVRKDIINSLGCLGIKLDEEANNVRSQFSLISSDDSKVKCYVIPTDEELMIARETYNLTK